MSKRKNGYVYIAYNPSIKGLRKIGYTTNLERRLKELSSHSGVPEDFRYNYWAEFPHPDYKEVESLVHDYFSSERVNNRREFFTSDCWEIINEIEYYDPLQSSLSKEERKYLVNRHTIIEDEEIPKELKEEETKELRELSVGWDMEDDLTQQVAMSKIKDKEKYSASGFISDVFWGSLNIGIIWGLSTYLTKRRLMESIERFDGDFDWLSNFFPCKVEFEGLTFDNSEAAFQAAKCLNPIEKTKFVGLAAGKSKRLGKKVELRPDWNDVKIDVMRQVLKAKFGQNKDLAEKLVATGDVQIVRR